jgi:hypothetical protein
LRRRRLDVRRKSIEAQIAALRAELQAEEQEVGKEQIFARDQKLRKEKDTAALGSRRSAGGARANGTWSPSA